VSINYTSDAIQLLPRVRTNRR